MASIERSFSFSPPSSANLFRSVGVGDRTLVVPRLLSGTRRFAVASAQSSSRAGRGCGEVLRRWRRMPDVRASAPTAEGYPLEILEVGESCRRPREAEPLAGEATPPRPGAGPRSPKLIQTRPKTRPSTHSDKGEAHREAFGSGRHVQSLLLPSTRRSSATSVIFSILPTSPFSAYRATFMSRRRARALPRCNSKCS